HKVNGEMQTDIQYYQRIVGVVLVSTDFPIPLGLRFQKNGEGEVSCALALLKDLVGQLGRRFLDVLVGDALYLQAPFVKEVERLGLVWAFTLKENQPELLRGAERFTPESPTGGHAARRRAWLGALAAARAGAPQRTHSSPPAEGRAGPATLDRARELAGRALWLETGELVLCSSGTEAVDLALRGAARRLPPGRSL